MDEEIELVGGFARRYRPTTLDGYVGNTKVTQTVSRTLKAEENKWPQVILITGNTGCGKTTVARIIVREYMCEDRDPEKGACGECSSCQIMDEYVKTGQNDATPDIKEIDIGRYSGKEDVGRLLDDMEIPPQSSKWSVYYFDEFHQATSQAQTSMLKVAEEPPEDTLIIMATTDPEKVLGTIRNRAQLKLDIKKPNPKELIAHLATICKKEGYRYDVEGLRQIAVMSGNVIRDALNYLEQVLKNYGDATAGSVADEFEIVGDDILFEFFDAYLKRDYVNYASILYRIEQDFSLTSFLPSLSTFVTNGIYVLNSVDVAVLGPEEISRYQKLFNRFTPSEVATLLANLKKLDKGDVLANFMAFIYTDQDFHTPTEGTKGYVEQHELPTISEKREEKVRSANIERARAAGSARAEGRLVEGLSSADDSDVLTHFQVKPVRER